jgi:hypothetical protein
MWGEKTKPEDRAYSYTSSFWDRSIENIDLWLRVLESLPTRDMDLTPTSFEGARSQRTEYMHLIQVFETEAERTLSLSSSFWSGDRERTSTSMLNTLKYQESSSYVEGERS